MDSSDVVNALKSASIAELDSTMERLNVEEYALCVVHLLYAKGKKLPRGPELRFGDDDMQVDSEYPIQIKFLLEVANLLNTMNVPTETRDLKKLAELCRLAVKCAVECQEAMRLVLPLRSFLIKYQNTSGIADVKLQHSREYSLTPFHTAFALASLHSKCYHAALPILNKPNFEVSPFITSLDVLEYFYYGGMINIGLKRFRDAAEFFLLVITAPANALSAIVIEAFKKYILVYLILHGDVPVLPKSTSVVVSHGLHAHTATYETFASQYKSKDLKAVVDFKNVNESEFAKSDNVGLVKQCIDALKHRRILDLTQTYTTVSLAKIASELTVFPEAPASELDAERIIMDMVRAGKISAKIMKDKSMVVFEEDSKDESALTDLHNSVQKTILLTERLREVDIALTKTPKYLGKVKGSVKASKAPEVDGPDDRWVTMNQVMGTSG
ncbi:COP9 signalosome complex subunit 3 [Thraustotheca clavata]|uniref:COP9 signalosome complex subunit 3 n=1 Tax=Thraustotheca clavata TaxID=74557 RepID=A0A1W0AA50_9STRA|nr:COP9 signalosome complex subunit 3 [Thraustotheca clavata]